MPDLMDVLWIFVKVVTVAALIDVCLLIIVWRIRVHDNNLKKRSMKDVLKVEPDEFWFSSEGQKELYSDFD